MVIALSWSVCVCVDVFVCVCVCGCGYVCADTMDKWDEEKLKEVVKKKHDEEGKPKTDIVSLGL